MKFYAIAYLHQEDIYFDFSKKEDVVGLENTCLLPTKDVAQQHIEDNLCDDYLPVEIELESLSKDGTWMWSRERVDRWDEDYE